ncbi:MAG: DarT ssDNA thymidine ADP-ribosyltransferase family protein [Salinarimonas sp.]
MTIDEFIQIMKKSTQGNQSLFHFTDTRNVPLIKQHGLLSANQRDALGISPVTTGGNELSQSADGWNNVRDYVHLCLRRNHPVAYRAKTEGRFVDTTFLPINPEILKIPGAMVSLDVANKTGARIMAVSEGVAQLDIEVLYTKTEWGHPEVKKRLDAAELCEILIPNHVPVEMIRF